MKPSSELDLLIAEKVMGLTVMPGSEEGKTVGDYIGPLYFSNNRWKPLDHYSTDISAAWEVVEKMKEDYMVRLQTNILGDWECYFTAPMESETIHYAGISKSAPHAICLAALRVKGIEYETE